MEQKSSQKIGKIVVKRKSSEKDNKKKRTSRAKVTDPKSPF